SHRVLSEHKTLSISWSHYLRDECIDERKLRGESPETVIAIFNRKLQNIFNQLIEYYFIKGGSGFPP
ncbi:hypothetical protein Q7687_17205, partial [Escherichia coli]|nr:hypothetical protein [Escherichia coli]